MSDNIQLEKLLADGMSLKTDTVFRIVVAWYVQLTDTILKYEGVYSGDWKDQMQRASLSVVLNIAEGLGKGGGYKKGYYLIARGSLFECIAGLLVGPSLFHNLIEISESTRLVIDKDISSIAGISIKQNWFN